jgi:hypothetical protein
MKRIGLIFALFCLPCMVFSAKERDLSHWNYNGNIDISCVYDNNINNAIDNDAVADSHMDLSASFFMQRLFNDKAFVELSSNLLYNYYVDRNSLNWQNIDTTIKTLYNFDDMWFTGLRARVAYNYRPNILNSSSELTGSDFTEDFSYLEYALNPIITCHISDDFSLELSDFFIKEQYKKTAGLIDYDNIDNAIHLTAKKSIEK